MTLSPSPPSRRRSPKSGYNRVSFQLPFLEVLLPHLHRGEAETIALAADTKAALVIIDEQEGRRYAVQSGLKVNRRARHSFACQGEWPDTGHQAGDKLLRSKARFFVAAHLESKILAAAGE